MELLAVQNQNIDGYDTEDILGRGFNTVVFKGRSTDALSSTVVVKVAKIPADFSSSDIFFDSSGLHHPNIVSTKKIGSLADGSVYSVRSYVEGDTLEGMVSQKGVLDSREVMHYLAQLASAIDYAHGQGVIHGNIKPSNVVVDGRFRAMLFDLGSRNSELLKAENDVLPVSFAHYRSPEQLRGEAAGPASDIFSLGVLAFELFTGSRPFPGRDFAAVSSNVLTSTSLTLDDVGSSLPKGLEECFTKALAKEPERRYSSAGDFVRALSRVMGTFIDEFGLVGGYSSLQQASSSNASVDINRRVRAQTVMTALKPEEFLREMEKESDEAEEEEELPPSSTIEASEVPSSVEEREPAAPKSPASTSFGAPLNPDTTGSSGMTQPSSGSQLRVVVFALLLGLVGAIGYRIFAKDSMTVTDLVVNDPEPEAPAEVVTPTSEVANTGLLSALASSSVSTIRGALEEAVRQGDISVLPEMTKLADSPEYIVRIDLIKALSQPPFFDRDESFAVISRLVNDNEYLVRGFAAKSLVASNRPDAAELLQQRLAEEKNAIVLEVLSRK